MVSGVYSITNSSDDISTTMGARGEPRTQGHSALTMMYLQCSEGGEGTGREDG